ncbi:MAG: hypothetical protein ABFE08_14780 [Armatimonadia bacterium]
MATLYLSGGKADFPIDLPENLRDLARVAEKHEDDLVATIDVALNAWKEGDFFRGYGEHVLESGETVRSLLSSVYWVLERWAVWDPSDEEVRKDLTALVPDTHQVEVIWSFLSKVKDRRELVVTLRDANNAPFGREAWTWAWRSVLTPVFARASESKRIDEPVAEPYGWIPVLTCTIYLDRGDETVSFTVPPDEFERFWGDLEREKQRMDVLTVVAKRLRENAS